MKLLEIDFPRCNLDGGVFLYAGHGRDSANLRMCGADKIQNRRERNRDRRYRMQMM